MCSMGPAELLGTTSTEVGLVELGRKVDVAEGKEAEGDKTLGVLQAMAP